MKKAILSLSLAVVLMLAAVTFPVAAELPTCDELDQMAGQLDEVAEVLAANGSIERGSELDKALGELVNALAQVA